MLSRCRGTDIAARPSMFQVLVQGVKAHWASKSSAPSGSCRSSGWAGGPDSAGVRTTSRSAKASPVRRAMVWTPARRSEEHTSELQSRGHLVCRLLLEKKKTRAYPEAEN